MSKLKLEHVYKIYPSQKKHEKDVLAVSDFNLEVNKKEFIVFVGPSGCGKSTTLRMIAGLEDITKGNIYIDDELMNRVEPKYRNIAMVFQNYALYPHMTAYQNMSFGLKNIKVPTPRKDKDGRPLVAIDKHLLSRIRCEKRKNTAQIKRIRKLIAEAEKLKDEIMALPQDSKERKNKEEKLEKVNNRFDLGTLKAYEEKGKQIDSDFDYFSKTPIQLYANRHLPKDEIDRRVRSAAKILDIEELLNRKPKAMSGGQRQRVALGRAIVRTPRLFLLDEPLSNLDAKLRAQMRVEITNLYNKLDVPFIYVTHDQVEAMTMGTRIVVLRKGVIQQVDTPTNLYDYPANRFVAGFLGTPQMNFFEVNLKKEGTSLHISLPYANSISVSLDDLRPLEESYLDGKEHKAILGIRAEDVKIMKNGLPLYVGLTETLGSDSLVYADFNKDSQSIHDSETSLVIKDEQRCTYKHGDKINVGFNLKKIQLFSDDETEHSIFKKPIEKR